MALLITNVCLVGMGSGPDPNDPTSFLPKIRDLTQSLLCGGGSLLYNFLRGSYPLSTGRINAGRKGGACRPGGEQERKGELWQLLSNTLVLQFICKCQNFKQCPLAPIFYEVKFCGWLHDFLWLHNRCLTITILGEHGMWCWFKHKLSDVRRSGFKSHFLMAIFKHLKVSICDFDSKWLLGITGSIYYYLLFWIYIGNPE